MFIEYKEWNPSAASLALIEQANDIIGEYERMGHALTLRQLYYQFVARGRIENSMRSYKNLGVIVTKAREAGLMSWEAIVDRTREQKSWFINESKQWVADETVSQIAYNLWDRQENYIEVWVEKEALSDVIRRPASRYQVPYLACKGFLSASEAWRAGRRFLEAQYRGQKGVIIHLGDHDPSGIDMSRDNQKRLDMFGEQCGAVVQRIALNMDQIEKYNPPPDFAKLKDTRAKDYIAQYGNMSWELDALSPDIIEGLITGAITQYIDHDKWEEALRDEEEDKKIFRKLARNWPAVEAFLEKVD